MFSRSDRKWLVWIGVAGGVLVLDQTTKFLFQSQTQLNRGISASLLSSVSPFVLITLVMAILVFLGWWGRQFWQRNPVSAGLLFGGGLSNLVDRLLIGAVRDWLLIPVLGWKNNLADYAIALAVILLLWVELRPDLSRSSQNLLRSLQKETKN